MKTDLAKIHAKFAATRQELAASLIERDDEIDLALTALLAREHLLLVGPPGVAKSLLLDSLMSWIGGRGFTVLLTKFSTPEEVFGPISVVGLQADRYVRITTGKLPEADTCFIDEVFKASSAILNSLLRILNERQYDVGDGTLRPVPLKLCVAASNEWPQGEAGARELSALFDRFVFRKQVHQVRGHANKQNLWWGGDHTPTLSTKVTDAELQTASAAALALPYSSDAKDVFERICRELAAEGIVPGDRRQCKGVKACRAFAWLNGADEVGVEHLEVLAHVLWDDPGEQAQKAGQVVARVANPAGAAVSSLLIEAEQILAATDVKKLDQVSACNAKLNEISKSLKKAAPASGRAAKALAYVQEQTKRIRTAAVEHAGI